MNKLETYVKEIIAEATKINFAGHTFLLKTDTNEDPTKKGVKVQFVPTEFGALSRTEQNDIAIELEERLEKGLADMAKEIVTTMITSKFTSSTGN